MNSLRMRKRILPLLLLSPSFPILQAQSKNIEHRAVALFCLPIYANDCVALALALALALAVAIDMLRGDYVAGALA
jgi:hypothetical protein